MSATVTPDSKPRDLAWSEERLVRECCLGNQAAWSALIDRYKNLIFSIPIRFGLSREDSADIFQAVCADLVAGLPRLREPKALPKWLMQVAHHQCYRWKQQQQRLVSRDADPDLHVPGTPAIAETLVQQTQEEQMLRDAVAALSPQCRRLVELLFFETPARPYREVAAELGLAVGSIGFTRQKCMDRLRKHLGDLGFD